MSTGHAGPPGGAQVKKLRDAGGVILGKVNSHELALGLTRVPSAVAARDSALAVKELGSASRSAYVCVHY